MRNRNEIAELLISHGININEKDKFGETALHTAASCNFLGTAKLLISHGINIIEKNNDGKTALDIAASNNCKNLILHCIKINEKDDDDKKAALQIAAINNSKETAEVLSFSDIFED
ncbi:hypothetical protein TVAG_297190 [Trichomonas vaginalis G3]|uniref:Uncharacterized protein n=1 Tax=Trichomonas vaginalis (strain ATCC PRA-98 / G3) TaxID=412133 RepID=A2DRB4_TRIV3|nr:positive regulation of myosin-light-chain-phosphatase protein [Trichomonas vaginalis G3]EAY17040.1 hypothetical protein TVAG_297190 [Trichomonas vaginalis G3]KAI5517903.1 positive regulation of myosin-light-chain-phosphatase protein [Trichomonas vaginalis G3]|eukprot:XP_001329263.1 hypothetical protein [Trichomonas vaginalis G3]